MKCRHCGSSIELVFLDLGTAPPSNSYLTRDDLNKGELWYPLRVLVCENCWLVQTEDFARPEELFNASYAYFSGFSETWCRHCECYAIGMIDKLGLDEKSLVVEVGCNDGTLLKYFMERGIPSLGIEPTASTARACRAKGITVLEQFFGEELAENLFYEGVSADLVVANNVLAHVPKINDFVAGFRVLLKPEGVATFEFPHLMRLIEYCQFDTIYHEHYSYLSLGTVRRIMDKANLHVFDVEEITTHGGSLRIYVQRRDGGKYTESLRVEDIIEKERAAGLFDARTYESFQAKVAKVKDDFLEFLIRAKRDGKVVAAYGAAAKGNTLFNYAGVKKDLVKFVADKNPAKQGKFLPGSRIPILPPEALKEHKPNYVLVIPWNLREEIMEQLAFIRGWGAKFLFAVPGLEVV
ncbi:MAG: class I SAM-dependent methyltransferase [Candidatus Methanomethyliaceae archaeon]